ncbi:MAG TPA: ATP-binding protein [Micromonosporaceae bacterium]
MLLAFRVSNFRSVRDEQELSLVRSRRLARTSADRAETDGRHWNLDVSPVSALYGGNASGKSNVLDAIHFMASAVDRSYSKWSPDGDIPFEPFRLDAAHIHEPLRLEIELLLQGVRHQYGFELNQREILREWLYAYPHGRRQTWFERDRDGADEWYFGRALGGRNRVIAELTRPNALFLSTAATSKHQQLSPIYHWLARRIRLDSSRNTQSRMLFTFHQLDACKELGEKLRQLLVLADLGIQDIKVRHKESTDEEKLRIIRLAKAMVASAEEPEGVDEDAVANALQRAGTYVELQHLCGDGSPPVGLPFETESLGTQALVALAGPLLQALRSGYLLMVDELDTSLHPRLVAELVKLFQSPVSNPKQAQLVFSTHDASLLGSLVGEAPILERDQVWFVEKDGSGATSVYPLTDFSPRRLENLERGYLQGRYGAVPFLKEKELISALGDAESVD